MNTYNTYSIVRINIITLNIHARNYDAPTLEEAVAMANEACEGTKMRVVYTYEGKPMYKEVFNN